MRFWLRFGRTGGAERGPEIVRQNDIPFTLTAHAENHLHGHDDLDDTIARLQAFEKAGADVLFAPGIGSYEQIRTVCAAVGKPVNVLAGPGMNLPEIIEAGAQRISVGGSLAYTAINAMARAATEILEGQTFSLLESRASVRKWFS